MNVDATVIAQSWSWCAAPGRSGRHLGPAIGIERVVEGSSDSKFLPIIGNGLLQPAQHRVDSGCLGPPRAPRRDVAVPDDSSQLDQGGVLVEPVLRDDDLEGAAPIGMGELA